MAECTSAPFCFSYIASLLVDCTSTSSTGLIEKRSLKMGDTEVPAKGYWPVDPQDDIAVSKDRIWVDGCFDFSHHGIVSAMMDLKS